MTDYDGFLAFLGPFCQKTHTVLSIFSPNMKGKKPFWYHSSTKQQQLSTCPSVLVTFRLSEAKPCRVV
jgi:hypothetical protein